MPKTIKNTNSLDKEKSIKKHRAPHRRSVRSEENIERVRKSVEENPIASIRQRSQQLGITPKMIQRILKEDLNLTKKKIEDNPNTKNGGSPENSN